MIHQINPPILVLTPKGEGHALFLIDYGPNINTVWVVHNFDDSMVIHVDSSEIKIFGNEMYDIPHPKPFKGRNVNFEDQGENIKAKMTRAMEIAAQEVKAKSKLMVRYGCSHCNWKRSFDIEEIVETKCPLCGGDKIYKL